MFYFNLKNLNKYYLGTNYNCYYNNAYYRLPRLHNMEQSLCSYTCKTGKLEIAKQWSYKLDLTTKTVVIRKNVEHC